jgi:hypothetical protein
MSGNSQSPGCLGLIVRLLAGGGPPSGAPEKLPYLKTDYLLSPAERSFYGVLCDATAEDYRIFAKVRLADVLAIAGNFDFLDFYMFGNTLMGTNTQCSGSAVSRLKENISHGVDHDLAVAPSSPTDHSGISGDPLIAKEDVECPSKLKEIQAIRFQMWSWPLNTEWCR